MKLDTIITAILIFYTIVFLIAASIGLGFLTTGTVWGVFGIGRVNLPFDIAQKNMFFQLTVFSIFWFIFLLVYSIEKVKE